MSHSLSLTQQDKQINTKIYDEYNRLHMQDGWAYNHKIENYKIMLSMIKAINTFLDGVSCLDVGCGSGDFSAFAKKYGIIDYLGVDLYEPAINLARKKYPHEKFILGDFLELDIIQVFDYAVCSGSLTLKLFTDNYAFL